MRGGSGRPSVSRWGGSGRPTEFPWGGSGRPLNPFSSASVSGVSFFSDGSGGPLAVAPGVSAWPVDTDHATLAVIRLEPSSLNPEHRHPNEQLGVLIEGSLTFRVADETRALLPGAMWRIPGDVPHEVVAGPEGATLVEAFAPGRSDWADRPRAAGIASPLGE